MEEIVGVRLSASLVETSLHFFNTHLLKIVVDTVADVFAHCSLKKRGLLLHDGDILAEPRILELSDITPTESHPAHNRVIEPFKQGYACRFAATARSHECNDARVVLTNAQRHALKRYDVGLQRVAELDALESQLTVDLVIGNSVKVLVVFVQDTRFVVEHLSEALCGAQHLEEVSEDEGDT